MIVQVTLKLLACMGPWRTPPLYSTLQELESNAKKPLQQQSSRSSVPLWWWVHVLVNRTLSYLSFFLYPLLHSTYLLFISFPFFFFFCLLDLVRPFLDLVRPDTVSVVFVFQFLTGSASKFIGTEFGRRPSLFSSNSSSPSLSIPPELFEISLACVSLLRNCPTEDLRAS